MQNGGGLALEAPGAVPRLDKSLAHICFWLGQGLAYFGDLFRIILGTVSHGISNHVGLK